MEKRNHRSMDTAVRKPFQGIKNILLFNWHFYIIAILSVLGVIYLKNTIIPENLHTYINLLIISISTTTISTIIFTIYIYDLSDLYQLNWLKEENTQQQILNIHAGFDETSTLLAQKYHNATIEILDFYDPKIHTEISIKRARKHYGVHKNTIKIKTAHIPYSDTTIDKIFLIFSAHEIRSQQEREMFFREIHRVLKADGTVYLVEHVRDTYNFIAYFIGFFHFLSLKTWYKTLKNSNLTIINKHKTTPFVNIFIIKKNGITN